MTVNNSQKLGSFVAHAMDRMEKDLPDAKLGEILLICEFQLPGESGTMYRSLCTDSRSHVQLGMLRESTLAAESREVKE